MAKICNVCGTKLGLLGTFKVQDGLICLSCSKLCSTWQIESISNIKKYRKVALTDKRAKISTRCMAMASYTGRYSLKLLGGVYSFFQGNFKAKMM